MCVLCFIIVYNVHFPSSDPLTESASQSVRLGVEPQIRYLLLFDSYGLVFVGAISDERTRLSFVYAVDPCQRSLSRVRVPRDSEPYFTVSDLRLRFSSPPTIRRITMEVLDHASTRQGQGHIATDGQSVSKPWCRAPAGTHDQIFSYYYLTVTFSSDLPS
jgi:hypothetical protein